MWADRKTVFLFFFATSFLGHSGEVAKVGSERGGWALFAHAVAASQQPAARRGGGCASGSCSVDGPSVRQEEGRAIAEAAAIHVDRMQSI